MGSGCPPAEPPVPFPSKQCWGSEQHPRLVSPYGEFPMTGRRAASSFLAAAAGWESVHESGHSYSSRFFDVLLDRFVRCSLLVPSFVAPKL